MSAWLTIAHKEWSDHLRNGWVLAITVAMTVFALLISLAGFGLAGSLGVGDQGATLLSLMSLVIYLIPLLGLLLGYDAVAGEHERGTMDLLLSFPISPVALLIGKWLGLSAVLALALTLGLASPMVLAVSGGQALGDWLIFGALSAWLGAAFIAIALLLSTLSRERGRLLGIALGLWLVLVVMFDLGVIALLVGTGGDVPPALVSALFYTNPASLFRFLGLRILLDADALAQTGFASAIPSAWSAALSLAGWTWVPLAAAALRFRRG